MKKKMKMLDGIGRFVQALVSIPYLGEGNLQYKPLARIRFYDGYKADFDMRDGSVVVDCANRNFMQPIFVSLPTEAELEDFVARATFAFWDRGVNVDLDQSFLCRRENGPDIRRVQEIIVSLRENQKKGEGNMPEGNKMKDLKGNRKGFLEECQKMWEDFRAYLKRDTEIPLTEDGWIVKNITGHIHNARPEWTVHRVHSMLQRLISLDLIEIKENKGRNTAKWAVYDKSWPEDVAAISKEKKRTASDSGSHGDVDVIGMSSVVVAAVQNGEDLRVVLDKMFRGMSTDVIKEVTLGIVNSCTATAMHFTRAAKAMDSYRRYVLSLEDLTEN